MRWRRRLAGVLAAFGVLLVVGGVVLNKTHAVALGAAQSVGITGMALFLGALVLATFSMAPVATESPHVVEGRERLRDAERLLGEALRLHAQEVRTPEDGDGAALTLPALWGVTHSRLDLYHEIALGQAKRSFRNAQMASGAGFALLVIFVVVSLRAGTTAGSVVAGGLGAVAAALSGYVSRTFVKAAEAAAAHLHAYFEQPLEFSRYLAAERMVRDGGLSARHRAEVLADLAKAMIADPPAATSVDDSAGTQAGPASRP
ncbi:hypothetical protein ACIHEJ_36010 [Streptomyces sp. NPDC052301]|uniref:hypothetical protein n=1 Tax=Streptomyces sp. NPDC052301 TaxID=3365687 RepID=UPI0037D715AC